MRGSLPRDPALILDTFRQRTAGQPNVLEAKREPVLLMQDIFALHPGEVENAVHLDWLSHTGYPIRSDHRMGLPLAEIWIKPIPVGGVRRCEKLGNDRHHTVSAF